MGIYSIMNQDTEIVRLECVENTIVQYKVINNCIFNIIDRLNLERWLGSRVNPAERRQIRQLLAVNKIITLEQYLNKTNSISFNDTLWIKLVGDSIKWEDVNPYGRSLSGYVIKYLSSGIEAFSKREVRSPEMTTGGSYDKLWINKNGTTRMIKFGRETREGYSSSEPFSEYYTWLIANQLGIKNIVRYNVINYRKKVATECKMFTSERYGFVSIHNTKYDSANLRQQMQIYDELDSLDKFREMLLLDSLSYNVDRHKNNYGFMIDNKTLRIIGINPIFDNNLALFPEIDFKLGVKYITDSVIYAYPKTMEDTFKAQGKYVLTEDLRHRLKNMYPFKIEDINISIERNRQREKFIETIVNNQIKAILN